MEIGNVIYFCTLTERHGGGRVKRQSFPRRPGGGKKIVITTGPLEFIGVRITPRPTGLIHECYRTHRIYNDIVDDCYCIRHRCVILFVVTYRYSLLQYCIIFNYIIVVVEPPPEGVRAHARKVVKRPEINLAKKKKRGPNGLVNGRKTVILISHTILLLCYYHKSPPAAVPPS